MVLEIEGCRLPIPPRISGGCLSNRVCEASYPLGVKHYYWGTFSGAQCRVVDNLSSLCQSRQFDTLRKPSRSVVDATSVEYSVQSPVPCHRLSAKHVLVTRALPSPS